MMQVETVAALRSAIRAMSGTVALVPTMGNLHEGHLILVREAKKYADNVLTSIFVNPMQFSADEDLEAYPRTLQRDAELLQAEGVDLLFTPNVEDLYPGNMAVQTKVEVPEISDLYCGVSRPGHFVGVATVVCKLFNMAQPDVAVFGKKDFQQLMVIRRMVRDLAIPVKVIGADTVREADGLAMSSRNGYLSEEQRRIAPALYQIMEQIAAHLQSGEKNYAQLERQAIEKFNSSGLKTDYFHILRADDLGSPKTDEKALVILAAAYLGKTRLIDNLEVIL